MKKLFALIGLLVLGMGNTLNAQEEAGDTQSKLDSVILLGIDLYTFNEERLPKIRFSATPGEKFVIHWTSRDFDTVLVENENEIEVVPSIKRSNYFNLIYLYALNPSGHITNIRIDSTYRNLQLRNCPLVDTINVAYNNLTSLLIFNCPAVKFIDISHNKLDAFWFGDVSNVTYLDCSHNDILDIDGEDYISLETLDCSYNRRLRNLWHSDFKALTNLTVRCNDSLEFLNVSNLPLQHLTCTENPKLSQILAINCRFQALDVSGNPALKELKCDYNQLTALTFNDCPALTSINCNYNKLDYIDLSPCKNLQNLYCRNNRLSSLDIRGLEKLEVLEISCNRFSTIEIPEDMKLSGLSCDSNHIPISTLVNLSQHVINDLVCSQFLNAPTLQVGNLLDLSGETHLSDCRYCEQYTIFLDGRKVESRYSDGAEDHDYGLFTFDKAGNYRLHLKCVLEGENYNDILSAYYDLTVVDSVVRPQFSIPSGAVVWPDTALVLSTATPDARIYYTTDGSEPDETALPYTVPIRITEAVTIKAIAIQDTFKSHIAIATYTIDTVARPTFSIPSGAAVWPDTVLVLSTATPNAKIYYTIDGSEPDETAWVCAAPIRITEAMTIKAIAIYKTVQSQVASASYTMDTVARPVFSIASGKIKRGTTVSLSTTMPDARIIYTTDGSEPDNNALEYTEPIRINEAITLKAIAIYKTVPSQVASASYTIDSVANGHDLRASKLRIYAKDRTIYLSEAVGEVEVFTMDGHCVYRGHDTAIPFKQIGIYIVSAAGRRWKVAVR